MENEFAPYELAVKLEKLGFDKPCFKRYKKFCNGNARLDNINGYQMYTNEGVICSIPAPLYQQAFDYCLRNIKTGYGYVCIVKDLDGLTLKSLNNGVERVLIEDASNTEMLEELLKITK